jgi:hypothetical protein
MVIGSSVNRVLDQRENAKYENNSLLVPAQFYHGWKSYMRVVIDCFLQDSDCSFADIPQCYLEAEG